MCRLGMVKLNKLPIFSKESKRTQSFCRGNMWNRLIQCSSYTRNVGKYCKSTNRIYIGNLSFELHVSVYELLK